MAGRLRIAINRLHRRLRQESLGGLSPAQASALGAVTASASPTLGELAAVEQVQPPTMTRIVASLAEAGMVTRITDATIAAAPGCASPRQGERSLERDPRRVRTPSYCAAWPSWSPDEQQHAAELVALLEHLLGEP